MKRYAFVILMLLAAQPASPQIKSDDAPRAGKPRPAEQSKPQNVFRFKHLTIDRKKRTITLEAMVVEASYSLEFLLCKAGSKEYESVLSTEALPWEVHAALLMLHLRPGKPGGYVGREYVPPRGAALRIELRWKDKAGKSHIAEAADWLKLSGEGAGKVKPARWIFVGSEVLPGGAYEADLNGGIIAVANLPSAVIDVPFASTQALEKREFVVDADAIPPAGTKVQMIITPDKGSERSPHARALLEIDRFGRMTIDGEAIDVSDLAKWAEQYTQEHKKGMIVIRSDPRALCAFAPIARTELRIGGVFEFEHRISPSPSPPLPRTPHQLTDALGEWKKRFAEPRKQIRDPSRNAQETLRRIREEQAELKHLDALWGQYYKALQKELDAYREVPQSDSAGGGKGK